MKPWEIYTWTFPEAGTHPAVIVSSAARVAHKPVVNVLLCSSQRASRPAQSHEVPLDSADGLEWETLCKCDLLHAAAVKDLWPQRGRVLLERQRQIVGCIIASLGWNLLH
jgi:mRNA-degrading endonuclease toxin of MazEF toxin-antitoxin module